MQKEGGIMAKKATLQVRMDADLKKKAESLYRDMGTSFAEVVRIFAMKRVQENGMPFGVTANRKNTYERLSQYADPQLVAEEEGAFTLTEVIAEVVYVLKCVCKIDKEEIFRTLRFL